MSPPGKVDQYERAGKAWPILIECAKNRRPITYGGLASKLNLHHRVCAFFLGKIQEYNLNNKLPPLQSLVVNKTTGKPGRGYIASSRDKISMAHEEVFDFDWSNIRNPFGF